MHYKKHLLLAGMVGLVTFGYAYHITSGVLQTEQVVVAARDIPQCTRLSPEMVSLASLPRAGVHPKAFRAKEDVVGRYSLEGLTQGEQLMEGSVSGTSGDGSIRDMLGVGERAMFIPAAVSRLVGGAIRRGDLVDVLFVADPRLTGEGGSSVLLRGVRVIDVRSEDGKQVREGDRRESPAGVVVSIMPEQCEMLAYALESGRIYLAVCSIETEMLPFPGHHDGTLDVLR